MKKLLTLIIIVILVMPSSKTLAQNQNDNEALAQVYSKLAQAQGGEMTKDEEEKLLKNLSPEMKAKLEEVKKLNKNKYYQLLREASQVNSWNAYFAAENYSVSRTLSPFAEASKERNEQLKKQKELEINVEIYALKYKNADNANQQKIKSDLQTALNQLFDIRESQKQDEVKQLEKRLQELKESLQTRKQNKNEIVQRRIQELLGDSKYLQWE